MPCWAGQGNAQQGQGQVRSGQAGGMCMGQDLEPMQLLQVRQILTDQPAQSRGVPEMFGQKTANGFPQMMDPMHVPGTSGEYVGDVFAKV